VVNKINAAFFSFLKYWLPFFVWAVVIFSFSANPAVKTSEIHWQDFIIKKTAHVIEYFIFSLLLYRALKSTGKFKSKDAIIIVLIIAFFYGLSDEFHQSFTPGREPRMRDVFIDAFGSLIFILVFYKFVPKNKKIKRLFNLLDVV